MRRMVCWALLAVGCGTGEGASYILLDQPAREARVEIDVDGRSYGGALPLEVEPGRQIELVTPGGRRRLTPAMGMLYEARGAGGEVQEWALGSDLRTDLVGVAGQDGVVQGLASALGAAAQRWNGRWRLEGPDALIRLAWMGDLPSVTDVAVVTTEAGQARARAALVAIADGPAAAPVRRTPDARLADLVGFYLGDAGDRLFLDAEGNYSWEQCDGPVGRCGERSCQRRQGTYRMGQGQLVMDGMDIAFQVTEAGRLEAPGMGFSVGGER